MNFSKDNKYFKIGVACVIVFAACAAIVILAMNISAVPKFFSALLTVLSPFIYGFFIAYICNPLMNFFEKKVFAFKGKAKKLTRPLSLVIALIILSLLISLVFIIVIPQLTKSYLDLKSNFTGYIDQAQNFADDFVKNFWLFNGQYENLSELLNTTEIATDLKELINQAGSLLTTVADYIITHAVSFVVEVKNIVMGIIVSIYFLLAKDTLAAQAKKISAAFLSRRRYLNLISLARYTDKTVGGFITGKILDSLIIGLLSFIVFALFKIPYYPLVSVIVGVTNIIPFFGPIIGAIPCAFIVLIAQPSKTILFIILILIIQQLDGNVIGPHILGDSTGLSALGVLVAITIGGGLFGLFGMFLGVPAYAVIREIFVQHLNRRLAHRSMPKALEFYSTDPPVDSISNKTIFIDKDTQIDEPHEDQTEDETNDNSTAEEPSKTKQSSVFGAIKKLILTLADKIKALFMKK